MSNNIVSEAKMNSMNKGELVAYCSTLQERLEAASSGPMTSSEIERRNLDLQKQVIAVREAADAREAAHEEKLAQIAADKEVSIKKLELEYNSGQGVDAEGLSQMYTELEQKAKKAMESLAFGLKEAEVEARAKLDEIEAKVSKSEGEAEVKISEASASIKSAVEDSKNVIEKIKVNHERQVEQIQYNNTIAIRDENLKVATEIATKHSRVIVFKSEYDELADHKTIDEHEIEALVKEAVDIKSREIYASEGSKLGTLKAETSQKIALLENDKTYLTEQVTQFKERVSSLEEQVKSHPDKIAAAVAAAKADIVVNQDAAGKR